MLKIIFLLLLLMPYNAFADEIDIIDFIIDHNPKIKAERALQGMNLKIEGKASAFAGALGNTTDKASVGVIVSVPLLDIREKKERQKEIAVSEEALRQQAAQLLLSLRESQSELRDSTEALKSKYAHLEWMRKRVEAGVDFQKDYQKEHESYMGMFRATEQAKAKVTGYLTSLLSLVEKSARTGFRAMLETKER